MYIVTTSNRRFQLTLLSFVAIHLLLGIGLHMHQTYVAQPKEREAQLLAVANQTSALQAHWINTEALTPDVERLVFAELLADLSHTNLPEAEIGAQKMLPMAMQLVTEDALLQQWLTAQLIDLQLPASDVHYLENSWRKKTLGNDESCFSMALGEAGWQLVSINHCP